MEEFSCEMSFPLFIGYLSHLWTQTPWPRHNLKLKSILMVTGNNVGGKKTSMSNASKKSMRVRKLLSAWDVFILHIAILSAF